MHHGCIAPSVPLWLPSQCFRNITREETSISKDSSLSSHSGSPQPPRSDALFITILLGENSYKAASGNNHTSAWLISSEGVTISPPRASSMPSDTFTADLASSLSPHAQVQQSQAGLAAKRAVSPVSAVTSDCWTNHMHLTDSCPLLYRSLPPSPLLTGDFAASQPASFNKKAESPKAVFGVLPAEPLVCQWRVCNMKGVRKLQRKVEDLPLQLPCSQQWG